MKQKKGKNIVVAALAGLGLVFLIFIGIFFMARITEVQVVGTAYYEDSNIKEIVLEGKKTANTFATYFKYRFGTQPKLAFVDKMTIQILNLHTIKITVVEKPIVGCIQYMGEYLYFDKDGIVVESTTKKEKSVPLIEGVVFTRMNLHEQLQVEEDGIFERIMQISQALTKYKVEIDRVVFSNKGKVYLYVDDITINLGKKELYDPQIAELSKLLVKARKKHLKGVLNMENFQKGQNRIILKKSKK